jgi:pSer/pThr/pTyr-binding forkhead associated (FHA) protein
MPITVIVPSADGSETRLTFDGMQRIVIGRGASCDVRLPDASVSHRHACLRAKGGDFILVDEGSTNGTFVGDVRIASRTSRIIRSGDAVRVGRVWLELRVEQAPITREIGAATRDLALAMVSQAMAALGNDLTPRVRVVEGADQGAALVLIEEGRSYVLGRGAKCDLPLSDGDTSREHVRVTRRGGGVFARDLGAKNGTWLGDGRSPPNQDVAWRPAQMMRIGRTVLALEEPIGEALARIESAPDEAMSASDPIRPVSRAISSSNSAAAVEPGVGTGARETATAAPMAQLPPQGEGSRKAPARFSITDVAVMATAIGVLVLSIAGLVWLLRG